MLIENRFVTMAERSIQQIAHHFLTFLAVHCYNLSHATGVCLSSFPGLRHNILRSRAIKGRLRKKFYSTLGKILAATGLADSRLCRQAYLRSYSLAFCCLS